MMTGPAADTPAASGADPSTLAASASASASASSDDLTSNAATLDPAARYPCNHCTPPKFFKRRHDRDRHIQTKHLNERPFSCPRPGCGLATNRRDQVRRHIKNHPKCAQHVRDQHLLDPAIGETLERVYGTAKWFVIFDSEMKEPAVPAPAAADTAAASGNGTSASVTPQPQPLPALPALPAQQMLPNGAAAAIPAMSLSPNMAAVQAHQQQQQQFLQQQQSLLFQQQQQQQMASWMSPSPAQLPTSLGPVSGLHQQPFLSPQQLASPTSHLLGANATTNASYSLLDMSTDPNMLPTFSLDMTSNTPGVPTTSHAATVSPFLTAAMGSVPQQRLSLTPDPNTLAASSQFGLGGFAGNHTLLQPGQQLQHPSLSPIPLPTLAPMPAPLPSLGAAINSQPTGMYPPSTIPTSSYQWPSTSSAAYTSAMYTSAGQPPLDAPLQATPLLGLEVGDAPANASSHNGAATNDEEEDDDEMEISRTLERMQLAAAEAAASSTATPTTAADSSASTSTTSTAPMYPPPIAPTSDSSFSGSTTTATATGDFVEEETVSLADIRPSIAIPPKPATSASSSPAGTGARQSTAQRHRQQQQRQQQQQQESTLDRMLKEATGEADPSGLFSKDSLDRLLRELGAASTASPRDSLDRILAGQSATADVDMLAAKLPGGPLGTLSSTLRSLDRNSLERIIKVASMSRDSEDLMDVDKRTLERMLEAYTSLGRGQGGGGLLGAASMGRGVDGECDITMMSIESLERELKRG